MNKFMNIFKYVVIGIASIIILGVLFGGCDNFGCRPDARRGYFGIICGGEF